VTPKEALAEREKLFADAEFFRLWSSGDGAAKERMEQICKDILGNPDGDWSKPPENFGRQGHNGLEIKPGSQHWRGEK